MRPPWPRLLAVLALSLAACTPSARQTQARVADAAAIVANGAGERLHLAEQAEGDAAIDAAPTREDAQRALAAVRARWAPVWAAWDAAQAAQGAWAVALASGSEAEAEAAAAKLASAYCGLRAAAPPSVPLPALPGHACPPPGAP